MQHTTDYDCDKALTLLHLQCKFAYGMQALEESSEEVDYDTLTMMAFGLKLTHEMSRLAGISVIVKGPKVTVVPYIEENLKEFGERLLNSIADGKE